MKWLGYRGTTPVDDTPGALETAQNVSRYVTGQLGRRKGMARSSIAKQTGAIKAIADFAVSPGLPRVVTSIGGTIDGVEGINAAWGDASLKALSGVSTPGTGSSFTITIDRGDSEFATSALVFARATYYPTESEPGTFVGEVTMEPWDNEVQTTWDAPASGTYRFRVYPVRDRVVGPGANMSPVDMGGFGDSDTLEMLIFDVITGLPINCTLSGPGAYITGNGGAAPTFALGQALMDAAITLPYQITLTPNASSLNVCFAQYTPSWGSADSVFLPAGVTNGVVCATVTADTGQNVSIA